MSHSSLSIATSVFNENVMKSFGASQKQLGPSQNYVHDEHLIFKEDTVLDQLQWDIYLLF